MTAISIGSVTLDSNIVLAPMAGVTDMPFRRLVKSFGVGLVVSEMIASLAMVYAARKTLKMSSCCREEQPMSVQIAGYQADIMAQAARLNEQRGAAIIDINMGCPAKKVVNGQSGSALMRDLDHAKSLIKAVVGAVSIPVTLKMRTGWDHETRNAPELAKIAEDCGVMALAVHGRTRCQFYKGSADWDFIATVKDAVSIPVFANGDITSIETAKECLKRSNADGLLIGRGTYGRPWLINQIDHYLSTGTALPDPDMSTQLDCILRHYQSMLDFYGEQGVKIARKHLGWYSKGLFGACEYRSAINQETDGQKVMTLIREFYTPLIERMAA